MISDIRGSSHRQPRCGSLGRVTRRRSNPVSTWLGWVAFVIVSAAVSAAAPALSEQVRKLIDEKGVDAARQEAPMLLLQSGNELTIDNDGMLALADDYIAEENFDAAELVLNLLLISGGGADVLAKLGDLYMTKGIPLGAAVFYQQALQTDPGHAHAKSQLDVIAKEHPELAMPGGAPPPAKAPPSPPTNEPAPPTQGGRDADDLLPYVVVTDPAEVAALDWAELRKRAGTSYPSRWDDLTLVDSCLWITPEELQKHLGLEYEVTAKRSDFQCKYRVHFPDGQTDVLLSVYVERYASAEKMRENEYEFSEGFPRLQFTPFDPGTPDLHVYLQNKSRYLYAFPADGVTMWRLGYKGSPLYTDWLSQPEGGVEKDIGAQYLQLLVVKYNGRL